MAEKKNAVALRPSEEVLAELGSSFTPETSFSGIQLPRITFVSQDKTETVKNPKTGKKELKIVTEAGTFFTERPTAKVDPTTGKPEWHKEQIGSTFTGIIVFKRKQLKYYDQSTESFVSSSVYDEDDEVIPLFKDGKEIARGTPKELQAEYEYIKDGKTRTNLEENRILYVLYNDDLYQLNLRSTSMFSYMAYARNVTPPTVVTAFDSEHQKSGQNEWNKITFKVVNEIDAEQASTVLAKSREIRDAIAQQKAFFASKDSIDKSFDSLN